MKVDGRMERKEKKRKRSEMFSGVWDDSEWESQSVSWASAQSESLRDWENQSVCDEYEWRRAFRKDVLLIWTAPHTWKLIKQASR